jgi:hypothetical protein
MPYFHLIIFEIFETSFQVHLPHAKAVLEISLGFFWW